MEKERAVIPYKHQLHNLNGSNVFGFFLLSVGTFCIAGIILKGIYSEKNSIKDKSALEETKKQAKLDDERCVSAGGYAVRFNLKQMLCLDNNIVVKYKEEDDSSN